jgi:probable F420-dependent oxidoreductase
MRVDVMTGGQSLARMQRLAGDAADAGFSGLVITEGGRTAYLQCAAATLAAPDLDILTGVAVAFPRSPMVTAQVAWELAEASNGKFRLGLGTQVRAHIERRYGAAFASPGPRLVEYVRAVRACFAGFRGEPFSFDGAFTKMSLLPAMWSPGRIDVADPPIDIAAVNPWMLRAAGGVADGVHVHPLNHPTYVRDVVLPNVAAGAAAAGRDAADVQLIVPLFTVPGDSEAERAPWRALARTQVAFYGSTPNYAFIFELLGRPGTTDALRERQKAGDIAGMSAVIDDDLLEPFIVEGNWSVLAGQIVERLHGVADRVVLYTAGMAYGGDRTHFDKLGAVARDLRDA